MSSFSGIFGGATGTKPIQTTILTSGSGTYTPSVSGGSWHLLTMCGTGCVYAASYQVNSPVLMRIPLFLTGSVNYSVGAPTTSSSGNPSSFAGIVSGNGTSSGGLNLSNLNSTSLGAPPAPELAMGSSIYWSAFPTANYGSGVSSGTTPSGVIIIEEFGLNI